MFLIKLVAHLVVGHLGNFEQFLAGKLRTKIGRLVANLF